MGGVVDTIVNVVTSFIGWLIPTPDIPDFDTPEEERGVLINKQSNNAQIPVVYGRRQVGITRVFIESSGTDNQYLYMAGVVCEGEIEEIEQIFVDDKRVIFDGDLDHGVVREVSGGDANFYKDSQSHIQIQAFNGTDDQVASSILTNSTNWTSNHRLRGVCYLAFRFKWNQDIFSQIPQVKVLLKGKKVYDPRDTTTKWTPNSVLVLLDYLRNTRYGKGLPDSAFETNFASFQTSATDSDTLIQPRTTSVSSQAGLFSELYNGYYSDFPSFFLNRSPTSSATVSSISAVSTNPYNSRRYYGYFTAPSSASFNFKTTSDDSSVVYIGDASQTVDNLFKEVENNKDAKLVVNNRGWHGTQTATGSKTLVSGSVYPIIIYYGNAPSNSALTFEWEVSGGSYSTSLSSNFTNGVDVTDFIPKIIKFESNAVIDTSQKVIENVKKLLNPMRSLFTYNDGVYKLKIEGTGSAVKTITSDHVVGGAKVLGERKNNKYNRVIGTYVNPFKNWQNDTVSFPPADDTNVESAFKHATMLSADNNTVLEGNFQFPNVTNTYNAEALCEVILRRSRNQLQIQLTLTSEFLELAIGDIVAITYPSGGFNAKPFRVLGLEINEDLTVNVQLFEHQDNFYTFNEKNAIPTIADTTLPDVFTVQPPASVTLDDTLVEYNDGTVIVALDITIGASTDSFVDYYQVEYKLSTDSDFIIYAQGTGLNHRVLNVIDQKIYDVRVKAINSLGVSSTYVTAQRTIIGAIEPPADVEDFSANVVGQQIHLSWTQVPDLDLAYYQLRFSEKTDGTGDWLNSVALIEKISRPATSISTVARRGTYLIKAVDKLGNFSSNATAIISNVVGVTNFNAIATASEHPDFDGTVTNVVVNDSTIQLDSSELFDSASGNFDAETTRFFDSGVSNSDFFSSGNYLFADVIDIGAKHTARITASLSQISDNPDDLFDNRSGLFDTTSSNFDGDTPANANAHLEIATSDDNSTYTAFQLFTIGNYTARYFKFRVVLISRDNASTPVVSEVTVTVDMEDRIFSGNNISSGAGTKTVAFDQSFKTTNYALGVTGEDMSTGDFFIVQNKTITGFDITFKNSSNTAISKTFDFIAKGF